MALMPIPFSRRWFPASTRWTEPHSVKDHAELLQSCRRDSISCYLHSFRSRGSPRDPSDKPSSLITSTNRLNECALRSDRLGIMECFFAGIRHFLYALSGIVESLLHKPRQLLPFGHGFVQAILHGAHNLVTRIFSGFRRKKNS